MYACMCQGVTEDQVRRAGSLGITAPGDLVAILGLDADRCCGRCAAHIEEFVELAWEGASQAGRGPVEPGPRPPVLVRA
jgi:bacterioferritin-associated ferredoxin